MKSDVNILKLIFTAGSCVGIFPLDGGQTKKIIHLTIIIGVELVMFLFRLDFIIRLAKTGISVEATMINQILTAFVFEFVCLFDMIYDSQKLNMFQILNKLDVKFKNIGNKSLQIYLPLFLFLTTAAFDIALLMVGYGFNFITYMYELLVFIQISIFLSTIFQFCYILRIKYNTLNAILNITIAKKKYGAYKTYTIIQEVGYCLSLLDKAACNFNIVNGKKNLVILLMTFGSILSTFYSITSISVAHSFHTSSVIILYYRLIIALVSTKVIYN